FHSVSREIKISERFTADFVALRNDGGPRLAVECRARVDFKTVGRLVKEFISGKGPENFSDFIIVSDDIVGGEDVTREYNNAAGTWVFTFYQFKKFCSDYVPALKPERGGSKIPKAVA